MNERLEMQHTHTHIRRNNIQSLKQKNEVVPFATRTEIEGIMLSEISQAKKDNHVVSLRGAI